MKYFNSMLLVCCLVFLVAAPVTQAFTLFPTASLFDPFFSPLHRPTLLDVRSPLMRLQKAHMCRSTAALNTPLTYTPFHVLPAKHGNGYVVEARLDGVNENDIALQLDEEHGVITVFAVRRPAAGCEEFVRPERLEKKIYLPAQALLSHIEGVLERGILHINIPVAQPKPTPPPQPRLPSLCGTPKSVNQQQQQQQQPSQQQLQQQQQHSSQQPQKQVESAAQPERMPSIALNDSPFAELHQELRQRFAKHKELLHLLGLEMPFPFEDLDVPTQSKQQQEQQQLLNADKETAPSDVANPAAPAPSSDNAASPSSTSDISQPAQSSSVDDASSTPKTVSERECGCHGNACGCVDTSVTESSTPTSSSFTVSSTSTSISSSSSPSSSPVTPSSSFSSSNEAVKAAAESTTWEQLEATLTHFNKALDPQAAAASSKRAAEAPKVKHVEVKATKKNSGDQVPRWFHTPLAEDKPAYYAKRPPHMAHEGVVDLDVLA